MYHTLLRFLGSYIFHGLLQEFNAFAGALQELSYTGLMTRAVPDQTKVWSVWCSIKRFLGLQGWHMTLCKGQLILSQPVAQSQHLQGSSLQAAVRWGPTCWGVWNGGHLSPKVLPDGGGVMLAGDLASEIGDLTINNLRSIIFIVTSGFFWRSCPLSLTSDVTGVCHFSSREESVGCLLPSWSLEPKYVL